MRSTIGAAKRLAVRQRIVPQSLICSVAGSAYLRNWISGTGISPASAMPTARPMMPSSLSEVSNTRSWPYLSCSPSVTAWTPPLGPTSSPNTSIFGLASSSWSSTRRIAVTMLIRWPSGAAIVASCRRGSGPRRRRPCSASPSKKTWRVTSAGNDTPRASASRARRLDVLRRPTLRSGPSRGRRRTPSAWAADRAPIRP